MKLFFKLKIWFWNLFHRKGYSNIKNFICFICGNEALPMPLEADEESILIEEIAKGSLVARDKLIEHNMRLVVYIAKKFDASGIDIEDLISIGAIGLIKAVNTFSNEKNIKLATYASRCIENEILMQLRKNTRIKSEISLDEPLSKDGEGNELLLADIISTEDDSVSKNIELSAEKQLLLGILTKLDKREQEIIILRFGLKGQDEMTQKEVADLLGISQSYISRIEKKILYKMRKKLLKVAEI